MILSLALAVTFLLLMVAMLHMTKLQEQVNSLDKEQHTQNDEIAVLMKNHLRHQEMLLQHIEVLKYLVDQDPMLNKTRMPYMGPIGEA